LVQRCAEKKIGSVLKLVFVEQMVCSPLYCTVGEAYKRKTATTLQLPFAFFSYVKPAIRLVGKSLHLTVLW
jgi:hypothetical protein